MADHGPHWPVRGHHSVCAWGAYFHSVTVTPGIFSLFSLFPGQQLICGYFIYPEMFPVDHGPHRPVRGHHSVRAWVRLCTFLLLQPTINTFADTAPSKWFWLIVGLIGIFLGITL